MLLFQKKKEKIVRNKTFKINNYKTQYYKNNISRNKKKE